MLYLWFWIFVGILSGCCEHLGTRKKMWRANEIFCFCFCLVTKKSKVRVKEK